MYELCSCAYRVPWGPLHRLGVTQRVRACCCQAAMHHLRQRGGGFTFSSKAFRASASAIAFCEIAARAPSSATSARTWSTRCGVASCHMAHAAFTTSCHVVLVWECWTGTLQRGLLEQVAYLAMDLCMQRNRITGGRESLCHLFAARDWMVIWPCRG